MAKKKLEEMSLAEVLADPEKTEQLKALLGGDAAALKLVNLTYNTPPELMSQMTVMGRRFVLPFSAAEVLTAEVLMDPDREVSLMTLFRQSVYRHMRSVGGMHLNSARMLAEAQMSAAEEEEEGGGEDLE